MVSLVIVSHSQSLADAVVQLVRQVATPDVRIATAAGLHVDSGPDGDASWEFGTDATRIATAIESVYSPDGVLVLMDLGSAILSTDMALELLPNAAEMRPHIRLCPAPLIEGALAAAIQAQLGAELDAVDAEARAALQPKLEQLAPAEQQPTAHAQTSPAIDTTAAGSASISVTLINQHGLHARPAARFVQTAAHFDAEIQVNKAGSADNPVPARSINRLATLGATQGDMLVITARGPQAAQALEALRQLVDSSFGESHPSHNEAQAQAPVEAQAQVSTQPPTPSTPLQATPVSEGIGIGPLLAYRAPAPPIPDDPAQDPAAEWARLQQAVDATRGAIAQRRRQTGAGIAAAQAAIFDAHLLILADADLLDRAHELIASPRLNAARAWHTAVDEVAARFRALAEPYIQQRAADVLDVGQQVLVALLGAAVADRIELPHPAVLVAQELTPTQVAQLDPAKVLGLVTLGGGATSHAAILTRALGIPAVTGADASIAMLPPGTPLAVDGFTGRLWVNPSAETLRELQARQAAWRERQQQLRQASREPTVTRDGRRVEIAANLGGLIDAQIALDNGAEAVGVLRTEFLYLTRNTPPSEDEQVAALRQVAELMRPRPVIVRTLDVGGDKAIPYLPLPPEANPFLGVRAIRLSLQRRDLFLIQLRAILRAGAGAGADCDMRVLLPMVSLAEELDDTRELLEQAHAELLAQGVPHRWPIPLGIMVETPAAALLAPVLAQRADFFSIGTNDLTQYTLAAERGNPSLTRFVDALHPAVLRLIEQVVSAAHAHGRWAGVCGEIASDPVAVPIMVGLGADELSLNAAAIPQVKAVVRALHMPAARALAHAALQSATATQARRLAEAFAAQLAQV